MIKKCEQCGTEFKGNKRAKYCSDACKQEAYRERKGIEKPKFLQKNLSGIPEKEVVKEPVKEKVAIEIPYSYQYQKIIDELAYTRKQIDMLTAEQVNIEKKIYATLNGNPQLIATIIGGIIGGAVGNIAGKTDTQKALFTILGAVGLGFLSGKISNEMSDSEQKLTKLRTRLSQVHFAITKEKVKLYELEEQRKSTPKYYVEKIRARKEAEAIQVEIPKIKPLQEIKVEEKKINATNLNLVKTAEEFSKMNFKSLGFDGKLYELIGDPEENFKLMLYGERGQGKSTFAVQLAEYLASKFGRVLYNSSEEKFSLSLKNKIEAIKSKEFLDVAAYTKTEDLIKYLKETSKKPRFLIIDSINDMNISIEDFRDIADLDEKRAIIYIMQATKTGNYKGQSEFAHEAHIIIKMENYTPVVEKTRYK